jgi:endonuclease/exonuclease/phosphatase family metal-dependent hydrolase
MTSSLQKLILSFVLGFPGIAYAANNPSGNGIRLMTLNVAHARARGSFQLFQTDEDARTNLTSIAKVINREQPHIVAFQELDRNSFWNGQFDHGQFIAEAANYNNWFTGTHQSGIKLDYGTGLMSKFGLENQTSVIFKQAFARTRKGFVLSTINWPEKSEVKVDLVSLHLDPISHTERRTELNTLLDALEGSDNLRIVMGDFNMQYDEERALIADLTTALDLHAFKPLKSELVTFQRSGKRLDWILVSREFEFLRHEILSDPVSDHQPVLAEITLL